MTQSADVILLSSVRRSGWDLYYNDESRGSGRLLSPRKQFGLFSLLYQLNGRIRFWNPSRTTGPPSASDNFERYGLFHAGKYEFELWKFSVRVSVFSFRHPLVAMCRFGS